MNVKYFIYVLVSFVMVTSCFDTNSVSSKNESNDSDDYFQQAETMFYARELENAYSLYLKSYNTEKNKITAYKLASCHSLLENIDSAFFYIEQGMSMDSSIYLLKSGEYYNLLNYAKWDSIIDCQFNKYQSKFGKLNDEELTKRIFNLSVKDQAFYLEYFFYPSRIDENTIEKNRINNIKELENIISEYGWPKSSDVCLEVSSTAFLILQHADLEFQKKYFSDLYNCVIIGEASTKNLAYLIDRINIRQGEKQLYGTQLEFNKEKKRFVLPNDIYDIQNLDKRRSDITLEPIADYIAKSNENKVLGAN